jgi:hypothetical protein
VARAEVVSPLVAPRCVAPSLGYFVESVDRLLSFRCACNSFHCDIPLLSCFFVVSFSFAPVLHTTVVIASEERRKPAETMAAVVGNGQDPAHHHQRPHDDTDESQSSLQSNVDLEKGGDEGALEDKEAEDNSNTPPAVSEQPPPKDPNLVEWDGPNDPENPLNWPRSKRWLLTVILATNTWMVTFASSISSSAVVPQAEEFGVATIVPTLATTLFVIGWGFGPLVSRVLCLLLTKGFADRVNSYGALAQRPLAGSVHSMLGTRYLR